MSFDSSSSAASRRKRGRPSSAAANNSRPNRGTGNTNKAAAPGRASASRGTNPSLSASSKSSSRKAPFADFGSYMAEKNRKLRDQFDAAASSSSRGGGSRESGGGGGGNAIFHGVSIFVDGYTVPSSQELRAYMLKHGGRFENYFSKQRVTHIVCTHLADSKMRNLRAFSRGLPVVKPTWVLDSVAANKLLSWIPYQLDELMTESRNQQKLSAFFTHKSISCFKDAEVPIDDCVKMETEGMLPDSDEFKNERVDESLNFRSQSSDEPASLEQENFCGERNAELNFADLEDESSVIEAFQSEPSRPSDTISIHCIDHSVIKEQGDATCPGDTNQRHSTLGDPNFVENYFKNVLLPFGHPTSLEEGFVVQIFSDICGGCNIYLGARIQI